MIEKLRRRFIAIYMVILSCFLVTILAGIYSIVYYSEVTQSEQIMQMALQNNSRIDDGNEPENSPPKKTIEFSDGNVSVASASGAYSQSEKYVSDGLDDSTNSYVLRSDLNALLFSQGDAWFGDGLLRPDGGEGFEEYGDYGEFQDPDFEEYGGDRDGEGWRPDARFGDRQDSESAPEGDSQPESESEPLSTQPAPEPDTEAQNVEPSEDATEEEPALDSEPDEPTEALDTTSDTDSTEESTEPTSDTASDTTSDTSETSDTEESTDATSEVPATQPSDGVPPVEPKDTSNVTEYEGNLARNTIYVRVNRDREIQKISYQYFESGDNLSLEQSVVEIIDSGYTSGKTEIDGVSFRYSVFEPDDQSGYEIVFLDRAIELSTLNRLLTIFVVIGGIGILLLFGLSWLLASWAITPIADAWNKQKQFIADASHELKTPLTVIATNTDVVLSNADDTVQNQAKWLNYIKSETGRMSKLVADLLYIAKSDVNEVAMVMTEFNLSHTTQGVCLIFESVAFENGKTLDTDIDEDVTFRGDEDRVKQLVTILIDNAIVHSEGRADILVTLKREPKDRVRLSVSNTHGEDIPKGYEERLFERFFRVDKARNRSNGSHGLGLNIAQSIVKNHGGTISVSSTRDHVVTFTVVL